tara:strand:+ start:27665 stop:28624 length:960 start_codon:yes stop_codon:yes gene_type:complete
MKTKVLVTGGLGFIGSSVVEALLKSGYDVTVVDDCSTTERAASPGDSTLPFNFRFGNEVRGNKNLPSVEFIRKNVIFSHQLVEVLKDVEYVFHLAAHPRVDPSIKDPIKYHEENINGSLNLFWACKNAGVKKIIFSSSSSVYGDPEFTPTDENGRLDPMSPYALHKLVGEQYLELFSKLYGLNSVSLRYFNVYGEGQPTQGSYVPVMGIFFRQLLSGQSLSLTGDGLQERDFVNVKDVARANVKAAETDLPDGHHIYNIGSGEKHSIKKIAQYIHNEIKHIEPRFEPKTTCADITKAKKELGWEPEHELFRWIAINSPK